MRNTLVRDPSNRFSSSLLLCLRVVIYCLERCHASDLLLCCHLLTYVAALLLPYRVTVLHMFYWRVFVPP